MNGNVIDRIFFILRAQIRFKFHSMKNIQLILFIFLTLSLHAQTNYKTFMEDIDSKSSKYSEIAQTIWNYAEMGYQEKQSSALLQKTLSDAGFRVEKGVAGIPTAFSATFGTNGPVIAILGEYDALPGLSQKMSLTKYQTTQEQVTDVAIIYLEQHQQQQQLPLKII